MPIYDAFGDRRKNEVMHDTWGHLAPVPGQVYYGSITFACGAYAGVVAFLSIDFATRDGVQLYDNPWSFGELTDYIMDWVCDQGNGYRNQKPIPVHQRFDTDGKVFTFHGSYTRFKNEACRIAGTFRERAIS